jgi:hypothetical protein
MGLNLEFKGIKPHKPHSAGAIDSSIECLIFAGKAYSHLLAWPQTEEVAIGWDNILLVLYSTQWLAIKSAVLS